MNKKLHTKTLLLLGLLSLSFVGYSQPQNDDCSGAYALEIATDEASCNFIEATTFLATPSSQPNNVCSGTSFADDVWFTFQTESLLQNGATVIKCYFNEPFVDVPSVGMAVYESCSWGADPLDCFSTADPERNQIILFHGSLSANHTYFVRVWSTPGMSVNSGTFRICAFEEPPSEDLILWGDIPGEGDFNGGMNGWSTVAVSPDTTAYWRWAACACSAGELENSILSAPSSYNGAAIFDADSLNCCLSDDPPPAIIQQTGELWSPIIDCSDFPSVALKFYQSYAALTSTTSIAYSIDGGNSWLDTIEVNAEFTPNQKSYSPSFHRIPILEAAGASQFRVKFIFSGNFFNWIIDDVQLVSLENNNLNLPKNTIAIAPNAMWPISQLECFEFQGDISNLGAASQPNVNFNIDIYEDPSNNLVYSDTENLGTLAPLVSIENQVIDGCFTPENTPNSYIGIYTVHSDSIDLYPETNIAGFDFETTEFVFAKERGGTKTIHPGILGGWDIDEPHSWAYGNFFHIVNGSEVEPKNYALSGTFSIGNADQQNIAGQVVSLFLYKWIEDTNDDGNMDPDEREKVAYQHYTIQGTETPLDLISRRLISFPNGDPNGFETIFLESDQNYVLMLEYSTTSNINVEFVASTAYDYSARISLSEQNGAPRYAGMLGVNGDLDSVAYNSIGFGRDVVPVVRLNLTDQLVKTANLVTQEVNLSLSPNPVSNILYLNTNLVETLPEATIRIFDLNGRLLIEKNYKNLHNETLSFDVSNFISGAYFLQFISKTSVKAERFVVQH